MERLNNLIEKFKPYQETHPNITNIWINYIKIKKEKLEALMEQGEKLVDTLENIEDLPIETVFFLIQLKQQMANENNT